MEKLISDFVCDQHFFGSVLRDFKASTTGYLMFRIPSDMGINA